MKRFVLMLAVLAMVATPAMADYTFPSFGLSPVNSTPITYALDTSGVPAGYYDGYEVSLDWSTTGTYSWSSEAQFGLETGYLADSGASPDGAYDNLPVTLNWAGSLTTGYTGGAMDFVGWQTYDEQNGAVSWDNISVTLIEGTPPLPPIWCEGFETSVPPAGWDAVSYSGHTGDEMWFQGTSAAEGLASAQCNYDPDLIPQDNWLVSPSATALPTMEVTGQTMGSYYWGVDPYDNYDLELWIIRGATYGDGDDDLVASIDDDNWLVNWTWEGFSYDISGYLTPGETFSVGFRYVGVDGAQGNIDDVCLRGIPEPATLAMLAFSGLALIRRRR